MTCDLEREALFIELSAILTGSRQLAGRTVERHLKSLIDNIGLAKIDALLDQFRAIKLCGNDIDEAIEAYLINDPAFGDVTRKILGLWYTGLISGVPLESQDDYFEAIMWEVIGAHPPALSDSYYGSWRFPPDVGE